MAKTTLISWADSTINFWSGCSRVSEGCRFCYAKALSDRFGNLGKFGKGAARKKHHSAEKLAISLNRKPWVCDECGHAASQDGDECDCGGVGAGVVKRHRRRVFSLSLGDWLDEEVPFDWLTDMLEVIRCCPNLDFLLLTKRPQDFHIQLLRAGTYKAHGPPPFIADWLDGRPPANVWFGFSAETQEQFDARWEHAKKIPCKQLFVSFEPLLSPINISPGADFWERKPWGIWGGESGLKARACFADWIRDGKMQFQAARCPVFVKQMGANVWSHNDDFHCPMSDLGKRGVQWKAHTKDKHGGDPEEWPEDLRVREWPERKEPTFNLLTGKGKIKSRSNEHEQDLTL